MGPIGCKVCLCEYRALPESKREEVRKRLHFTDNMLSIPLGGGTVNADCIKFSATDYEIKSLKRENARLRRALTLIMDPVTYFRRKRDKDEERIRKLKQEDIEQYYRIADEYERHKPERYMGLAMSESPSYLRQIASDCLCGVGYYDEEVEE